VPREAAPRRGITAWIASLLELIYVVFRGDYPATRGVVTITLLFYVAESYCGGVFAPEAMIRLGALNADRVVDHHEYYRILCPLFLHYGPLHLGLNMLAFLQLGTLTEQLYGSMRMILFFLISGTCASLASMWLTAPTMAGSVGASGAIMGLAGVILGLAFYGRGPLRKRIHDWVGRALLRGVVATFALGLVIWLVLPVVDNAAHFGGFVAGLALAGLVRDPHQPLHRHTRGWAGVGIALTGLSWGAMAADGSQAVQAMHIQRAEQCESDLLSVSVDPVSRPEVSYLLACAVESWHAAGQPDRAEAVTVRLMDAGTETPEVLQYAGSLLIETDASKEALLLLNAWHERAPSLASSNALAWHLLTARDPAHRDPERALALLEAFPVPASTDPFETALVQDTLAQALFQVGRTHEAIPLQEQAFRTCLTTPLAWVQPGELWRMRQRLKTMRRARDAAP